MQPNVDELIWRTQIKDNLSIVRGGHTWKMGGEWMHTLNDQVFRGFFTGRYLFDSVEGFLRYTSPAAPGGFGPRHAGCSNGVVRDAAGGVSGGNDADRRPAVLLSAGRGPNRAGDRRDRRLDDRQRGVLAVRSGSVAGAQQRDAAVRPAMGCAVDAGDRRSADDGVRAVPERSASSHPTARFPISWRCGSRGRARRGTCAATGGRCCARAPASTSRARTCSARSGR